MTTAPTIEATDDLATLLQFDEQLETVEEDGAVESVTSGDSGAFGAPLGQETSTVEADDQQPAETLANNDEEGDESETAVVSNTPRPTATPTTTSTADARPALPSTLHPSGPHGWSKVSTDV